MRTKTRLKKASLGSTLAAATLGFAVLFGTTAQARPSDRAMPPSQNFPSMPAVEVVGNAPAQPAQSAPAVKAAPAPAKATPAPAPASAKSTAGCAVSGAGQFNSNLYTIDKTLVSSGQLVGSDYQYRLRVTALEDITNITAVEHLPAGLSYVSSEPSAKVSGNDLNWSWPSMKKGEVKDLLVTVRPQTEGNFVTSSRVCVDPMVTLPLFAGSPRLEITKTGPATAERGEDIAFRIAVRNAGTGVARNVTLADILPAGMTSSSDLKPAIGDLNPGETREVTVIAKAQNVGQLTNIAQANYVGGQPVQAQAPVNIVESKLGISKVGTPRTYVFKTASYQIVVRNDGNTTLSNVVVTDDLPKGTELVSTEPAGQAGRGSVSWTIPTLAAGQARTFNVVLTNATTGETLNAALATGNAPTGRTLTAKAEARTEWEGPPGVLTEMVDTVDPIRVGQTTTYNIEIKNQGNFKPVNGQYKVTFSPHLRPMTTGGDFQGTIEGQTVTFPDVLLEPRRTIKLRIDAQGVKTGSGRARLEFMSSFLDEPVIKDESTFVY
ncbi:DUF11 domain-containing protein [Opitutaceae bacterium TAV4]|nr:DUF11 domain-containing protein [Opitutaceae bacterium TAV4]RRK00486.1 DUF11 domain-containing protein [Opitutaceae bacterium TAV3]